VEPANRSNLATITTSIELLAAGRELHATEFVYPQAHIKTLTSKIESTTVVSLS